MTFLYSIVLWKLLAEYVIVRTVITTREQTMRCLKLSLLGACRRLRYRCPAIPDLHGVTGFLAKYYTPTGLDTSLTTGRGGSLLGLPAAVADLAILNLGIAVAMIVRGHPRRLWLGGLAALYGARRGGRGGILNVHWSFRGARRAHGSHEIGPYRGLYASGRACRRSVALASDPGPSRWLQFRHGPSG